LINGNEGMPAKAGNYCRTINLNDFPFVID